MKFYLEGLVHTVEKISQKNSDGSFQEVQLLHRAGLAEFRYFGEENLREGETIGAILEVSANKYGVNCTARKLQKIKTEKAEIKKVV